MMQITEILRCCPFFSRLDDAARVRLEAIAQVKEFEKGQVIFRQDDPAHGMYIVTEGLVRVYKLAPNGKEHVLHLADRYKTFAEVATLANFPCPAFAEAVEPTTCIMLPIKPLNELLRSDHELCLQILTGMSFWVKHLIDLLEDIVLRDAVGRVSRYLLDATATSDNIIFLPSLKKHLASHLNLTSETLSRTLRRLTDQNMIESVGAQAIRINNPDGLEDAAAGVFPRI